MRVRWPLQQMTISSRRTPSCIMWTEQAVHADHARLVVHDALRGVPAPVIAFL